MKIAKLMMIVLLAAACRGERVSETAGDAAQQARETATNVAQETRELAEAPLGTGRTAEELERERFDARWRQLQSFQAARDQRPGGPGAQTAANVRFNSDPNYKESLDNVDPAQMESLPVVVPIKGDRRGPSVLRAQVYLDRLNFSPGIIDGRWGKNSEIAVYWFQRQNGIQPTGEIDQATFNALAANAGGPALVQHTLTADDLKGPFKKIPDDVYEQEKLDCLCYESLEEKLGEQFHTSPEFLTKLNPNANFSSAAAGQQIWVPNVRPAGQLPAGLAKVIVSVEGNYLHAVDGSGNIVFHAPTTLGSEYDPSPTETLEIKKVTFNPWFHYQPKLFHEVDDTEAEANLAPGPNSPVGVVWAALSKRHYGIHGTRDPGSIGYASSHGCVRLTNWDARDLAQRLQPGMTVEFVDTREGSGKKS
jgi:lipoprotein-anchoring transpeptidase ErfK/SrfK